MSRVKLNHGLAALIFIACLFSGWSTLLTVTILALLFCEFDDKVKNVIVKVLTFYAGYTLVSMGWNLIYDGAALIFDAIEKVVAIINSYLDPIDAISLGELNSYLINPIKYILSILDQVIVYLLTFAKFAFIIAILTNKTGKENPISKKINEYVSKIVDYVNNFGNTQTYTENVNAQAYSQQTQAYAQQTQAYAQTVAMQQTMEQQTYNNQNMQ